MHVRHRVVLCLRSTGPGPRPPAGGGAETRGDPGRCAGAALYLVSLVAFRVRCAGPPDGHRLVAAAACAALVPLATDVSALAALAALAAVCAALIAYEAARAGSAGSRAA